MTASKRIVLSSGLLLAALLFLLSQFPHDSLWYDETTSAYLATHDWGQLWDWATGLDIHPPLYNALLKLWVYGLGDSQFSLRLFSVLVGWLGIAGMICLGQQITGRWIGGWASAVTLLLTGGFLYAAYEVRSYMLAVTLGIHSSIFLLRFLRHQRKLDGLIYGILVLSVLLVHYAAVFLLTAHGLYALLTRIYTSARIKSSLRLVTEPVLSVGVIEDQNRQRNREDLGERSTFAGSSLAILFTSSFNTLWIFAIPVIGFTSWYLILLQNGGLPEGLSFEGDVPIETAMQQYWEFFLYGQVIPDTTAHQIAQLFAALLLIVLIWRNRKVASLPLLLTIIPLAGLALLFMLGEAKLSGRHGWVIWIGVPLLIADTLRWQRFGRIALLGLLLFLASATAFNRPALTDQYPSDLSGAFAYINRHADPSDVLVLRDGTLFTAAEYYDVAIPYIGLPNDPLTNVNHKLTFHEATTLLSQVPANTAANIWVLSWQGDTMEPQHLAYALAEYAGGTPEETLQLGDVYLVRYAVERDVAGLFDHIIAFPGILQVPLNGPSLLGADIYIEETGAGCPVIIHTWWWRGATDDESARISYRIVAANDPGHRYSQHDDYLSAMTYPQREWLPTTPTLGRGVLTLPDDVGEVTIGITVYDSTGVKMAQDHELATVQIEGEPCEEVVFP